MHSEANSTTPPTYRLDAGRPWLFGYSALVKTSRGGLLVHDETAVDTQRLPRHVAGARPGEEGDHVRHVLRLLHAPEGYGGRAMPRELLRRHAEERALLLGHLRPHVRLHEARAHAVHADAFVRVGEGQALGHADNGGLARVVRQVGLASDLARHGGETHDTAVL